MIKDDEKSILTVSENDILDMSDKIRQNNIEDKQFAKQLDEFIHRSGNTNYLTVGQTSNALSLAGAESTLKTIIAPRTILKCMSSPEERYHGHNLSQDIMEQLPKELRNPVMIFKGNKDNSLVAISELYDSVGRKIMIAIDLNVTHTHYIVNRISSVYGRNNFDNYIRKQVECGNMLACNKEKADKMFQSLGLQSPPEETFISYDNSIAYSMKNVNTHNLTKSIDVSRQSILAPKKDRSEQEHNKPSLLAKLQQKKKEVQKQKQLNIQKQKNKNDMEI